MDHPCAGQSNIISYKYFTREGLATVAVATGFLAMVAALVSLVAALPTKEMLQSRAARNRFFFIVVELVKGEKSISGGMPEIRLGLGATLGQVPIVAIHCIRGGSPAFDRYYGKIVERNDTGFLFDTETVFLLQAGLFQFNASACWNSS